MLPMSALRSTILVGFHLVFGTKIRVELLDDRSLHYIVKFAISTATREGYRFSKWYQKIGLGQLPKLKSECMLIDIW